MARRSGTPPAKQPARLSIQELQAGIGRLQKRVAEVNQFDPASVTDQYNIPHVKALSASIDDALARTFGPDSLDYERYKRASHFDNGPHNYAYEVPISDVHESLERSKQQSAALLKQAIESLNEQLTENGPAPDIQIPGSTLKPAKRVFIVHGHDAGTKEAVARFIEKLELEAIVLHERVNRGRTIITKFREEADGVGFAIILMTPDDHGGKAGEGTGPRARQNVVFELGFFIGKLGPGNVAALVKGNVEIPSDFEGVAYISLERDDWQRKLGQELEAAGYKVDWNLVMRS